jgi:hypothetical protein
MQSRGWSSPSMQSRGWRSPSMLSSSSKLQELAGHLGEGRRSFQLELVRRRRVTEFDFYQTLAPSARPCLYMGARPACSSRQAPNRARTAIVCANSGSSTGSTRCGIPLCAHLDAATRVDARLHAQLVPLRRCARLAPAHPYRRGAMPSLLS